jgi:hypothetical protein
MVKAPLKLLLKGKELFLKMTYLQLKSMLKLKGILSFSVHLVTCFFSKRGINGHKG